MKFKFSFIEVNLYVCVKATGFKLIRNGQKHFVSFLLPKLDLQHSGIDTTVPVEEQSFRNKITVLKLHCAMENVFVPCNSEVGFGYPWLTHTSVNRFSKLNFFLRHGTCVELLSITDAPRRRAKYRQWYRLDL